MVPMCTADPILFAHDGAGLRSPAALNEIARDRQAMYFWKISKRPAFVMAATRYFFKVPTAK